MLFLHSQIFHYIENGCLINPKGFFFFFFATIKALKRYAVGTLLDLLWELMTKAAQAVNPIIRHLVLAEQSQENFPL